VQQGIDQPETTDQESTLLARHAVAGPITKHEIADAQFVLNGGNGIRENVVLHRKGQRRRQEQGCVHALAIIGLNKTAVGVSLDIRNDLISRPLPMRTASNQLEGTVERHPAHDLAMHVVHGGTARLPKTLFRLAPMFHDKVGKRLKHGAGLAIESPAKSLVEDRPVQDLSIDIES
jgi:hypothetical protein